MAAVDLASLLADHQVNTCDNTIVADASMNRARFI